MTDPTRVLIIDDHPLFRRGLSQLLELARSFALVGEAASGQEGIELARRLDPDLIGRFYSGRTTARDKIRILSGKPPVPVRKALRAIRAKKKK